MTARYADFQQITRSRSEPYPVAAQAVLEPVSLAFLGPLFPSKLRVRLPGAKVSNLEAQARPGPVGARAAARRAGLWRRQCLFSRQYG